jgi:hypothetical protein
MCFLCLLWLIQDFADNCREGIVLEGFVAWQLTVQIAAEDGVMREPFEQILTQ